MKLNIIAFVLVGGLCLSVSSPCHAQTLIEKLKKQLEENLEKNADSQPATPTEPAARDAEPPAPEIDSLPPPVKPSNRSSTSRGALGIRVASVTSESARANQLVVSRGALITAIEKGSPAELAGLPLGGAIVAINGRRIDSPNQLLTALSAIPPGRDFEVSYYQRDRMSRKTLRMPAGQSRELLSIADEPTNIGSQPSPSAAPTTRTPANQPLPSIGGQLGAGGSRPLLGRIGRALDNVISQAQAIEPITDNPPNVQPNVIATGRADENPEVASLRQQVEILQQQVKALQRSVEALEKKLDDQR